MKNFKNIKIKNEKQNKRKNEKIIKKVRSIISRLEFKNRGHVLNFKVQAHFGNFDHQRVYFKILNLRSPLMIKILKDI